MPTTQRGRQAKTSVNATPPDLAPQNNLAVPVEADEMKDILADVDTYDGDAMQRLVRFIVCGMALLMSAGQSLLRLTCSLRGAPVHPINGHRLN